MCIYNYIPQKYWEAFIAHGFYLKPASEFADKLEVRYGTICGLLCRRMAWPDAVEEAFRNRGLSECLRSALVSCWTCEDRCRECMWSIYGQNGPAVRVGVDLDKLKCGFRREIDTLKSYGAMGKVDYDRKKRSHVNPMANAPAFHGDIKDFSFSNPSAYNTYLTDLFLKHKYYEFEEEYRLTRFAKNAGHAEWIDPQDSVIEIQFSPIRSCDADSWIDRFESRFRGAKVVSCDGS